MLSALSGVPPAHGMRGGSLLFQRVKVTNQLSGALLDIPAKGRAARVGAVVVSAVVVRRSSEQRPLRRARCQEQRTQAATHQQAPAGCEQCETAPTCALFKKEFLGAEACVRGFDQPH
jgi:hypothetical protein